MTIQTFLTRVPLLLSYPTVILSSRLVVVLNDNDVPPDIGSFQVAILRYILRLFLIPIFTASSFVSIGYMLRSLHDKRYIFPIFLFTFIASCLTYLLGSVQTTAITLLSINLLFSKYYELNENKKNKLTLKELIFIYFPLYIVSSIVYCVRNNEKLQNFRDYSNRLICPTLTYTIIISLLYFSVPYIILPLIEQKKSQMESVNVDNISTNRKMVSFSLLLLQVSSFVLIYFSTLWITVFKVQFLIVFVFSGSLVVFYLTLQDLMNSNTVMNSNSQLIFKNLHVAWITKFTTFYTGIMSLLLNYLSFKTFTGRKTTDILTVLYIILSEGLLYWTTNNYQHKETHHSHLHDSNGKHSHSEGKHEDMHDIYKLSPHEHSHTPLGVFREMASNQETRSIFSFLLLNTTFMFVQLLYSFRSKSLGLLSDSLHMALDCTSLLLGLLAGILSKRPPSDKYPFGFEYLETITGFTNGILLLGIVAGIFIQAVGRIFNPIQIEGTNELIIVASLGLGVNIIGLFAFDHGGHSGHSGNDNMRGVFLHVLADTLGSVGVIISSVLIKFTHIHIFDPIASILIGVFILISAIPLINSTSRSILLKLDDKKHNNLKSALHKISTTPGISGYTSPRFWPNIPNASGHSHGHSHSHDHSHNHEDIDSNNYSHNHKHDYLTNSEKTEEKPITLVGYIHIQYVEGENSTIIKKRVEKIFETFQIKAWIQVESTASYCWCRASSYLSQVMNTQNLPSEKLS
ncbi:hypothetical protein TPHA_0L01000 [Tetrapisispora phaffii CBS 4417]|uniref:Zinc transporter n=1 Tax=Tetrapisispora phaffii (strain ATCC 24235 / CBS 4417 / NBRC 1672 / NRRL Y-8282 / UCD 70-5) TaxID=1071381 RepID=G8BZX9_TETPH|nr:hypothetical protein TPHA_0L01000 [Tetrapisispora phaffii CBS 4417]CCE65457.1 hypothetical protein TPHA_0L01000 [Tetrapisispora phaffii CBS 4417]